MIRSIVIAGVVGWLVRWLVDGGTTLVVGLGPWPAQQQGITL